MELPQVETLILTLKDPVLNVTINRPKSRNAMSLQMVNELMAVFEAIETDKKVRAVVLGHPGNLLWIFPIRVILLKLREQVCGDHLPSSLTVRAGLLREVSCTTTDFHVLANEVEIVPLGFGIDRFLITLQRGKIAILGVFIAVVLAVHEPVRVLKKKRPGQQMGNGVRAPIEVHIETEPQP